MLPKFWGLKKKGGGYFKIYINILLSLRKKKNYISQTLIYIEIVLTSTKVQPYLTFSKINLNYVCFIP